MRLTLLLLLLLFATPSAAQQSPWRPIGPYNGPASGEVVVGEGGWRYYSDPHREGGHGSPTHQGTVFRSSDGGKSWSRLTIPRFQNMVANGIGDVYGVDSGKVYASADHGATWRLLIDTAASLVRPLVSPNSGWTAVLFSGSGPLFMRAHLSSDRGATWRVRTIQGDASQNAYLTNAGTLIYKYNDSIMSLTESGVRSSIAYSRSGSYFIVGDTLVFGVSDNFSALRLVAPFDTVVGSNKPSGLDKFILDSNGVVYAVASRVRIVRSVDLGGTWEKVFDVSGTVTSMQASQDKKLWISTSASGVMSYDPATGELDSTANGINNLMVTEAYVPKDGSIVTGASSRGLLLSSDQGESWYRSGSYAQVDKAWPTYMKSLAVNEYDSQPTMWAILGELYVRDRLVRSTNRGAVWDTAYKGELYWVTAVGEAAFAAAEGSLLKLQPGTDPELLPYPAGDDLIAQRNGTLIHNRDVNSLLSTDKGLTWSPLAMSAPTDRSAAYARGVLVYCEPGKLMRSTDLGLTRKVITPVTAFGAITIDTAENFLGYFTIGKETGLYRSSDGLDWTMALPQIERGLARVFELKVNDDGKVFAATTMGIWVANLPALPVLTVSNDSKHLIELEKIGPNRWTLPDRYRPDGVRVMDVLGRTHVLPKDNLIDLSGSAAGLYYLQARQEDGSIATVRLIVRK